MEALKLNYYKELDRSAFAEYYLAGFDNTRLHLASWMPDTAPKAIILLVHGLGDHILRFDHWARFFNTKRFGVLGIDVRGHGKSSGKRGSGCLSDLMRDIETLNSYARNIYPHVPRILYGHSMGGNLVMNYSMGSKTGVTGLITTSPWLRLCRPPTGMGLKLANLVARVFPSITISHPLNSADLSRDLTITKSYSMDPLVHERISVKLFHEISQAGESILQKRHRFNLPLLMLHGTRDKVTSWYACAEFAQYTSNKTCFKRWEGGFHELHNELDKEEVFDFITQWIEQSLLNRRIN